MKKIICLIGKSGSGKSTIEQKLCSDLKINHIISHTTRPPRKEVTFQEAYKAVYDGKTIQSGLTGNKYISSIVVWNRDEVKGKWYILD